MINKLFGKKMGMTRIFLEEGKSVPVTVLKVGPCVVTQKKTQPKDGYDAIQVGYEPIKDTKINRPMKGHFAASGQGCFAHLKEIRVEDAEQFELGHELSVDIFTAGDLVNVCAISKGRGFAGVMKRWGFGGGRKTHGSRSHRIPGSIGCSAYPSRVQKGKKLPGRMGNHRVTIKNLEVVDARPEMNLVVIKGSVPGSSNSLLEITKG
ncbi:50S ribosomal subunit protein L3 [uncultured Desulfobacterium sp.]|uniref:Large ribosomal subunit protein uL3 n=1 Tax=uncultured Desulfobacterium sp. TaxID=201089 RepID=A0A445MRZ2_9BACT|nr:50S ribosomal subunit protein L3 [uncultured Desulfobacterium sp.]